MPDEMRDNLEGMVITKFRGDKSLLEPGIDAITERTGVPVLGVIPAASFDLPAEDSVGLGDESSPTTIGSVDQAGTETVTIGVPRFPHISNFTDVFPLGRVPGVKVDILPLRASLESIDAVILPGTKNTVDDLERVRETGLGEQLTEFSGPILGICGGYQMMGTTLHNIGVESTNRSGSMTGLGLLPVETTFSQEKHVEQNEYNITRTQLLGDVSGSVTGFELHLGTTEKLCEIACPLGPESSATDQYFGTYLHGLFDNENFRTAFVTCVFDQAQKTRSCEPQKPNSPIDTVADLLVTHTDFSPLDVPVTGEGRG